MDELCSEKYHQMLLLYGDKLTVVQSEIDPDETYYYYNGVHIGTLTMSCKDGKVGISFELIQDNNKC